MHAYTLLKVDMHTLPLFFTLFVLPLPYKDRQRFQKSCTFLSFSCTAIGLKSKQNQILFVKFVFLFIYLFLLSFCTFAISLLDISCKLCYCNYETPCTSSSTHYC